MSNFLTEARRAGHTLTRAILAASLALGAVGLCLSRGELQTAAAEAGKGDFAAYTEKIPKSIVEIEMIPISGGSFEMKQEDGSLKKVDVKPFWIAKTELTWDAYDIYAYKLDVVESKPKEPADAVARPTKPYGNPDRGFGHEGYAALSMTYKAAKHFCEWISLKTGKKYRLATEAEWEFACRAGSDKCPTGDELGKYAWYWDNADDTTHEIAGKQPNAWGLYDMLGNVAEWCEGMGKEPVVRGGSYDDDPEDVTCQARAKYDEDWQMSDPQDPKSPWWLSDATHVGFRIVCSKE